MREADYQRGISTLIADRGIRGFWQPQTEAFFDIRVTDTDARSYAQRSVTAVLAKAEEEKKKKYLQAVEESRASFSPFVLSVDGFMAREAKFFMKHLGEKLAVKWSKSYSVVMGWIRARLSFAVLRATNLCLRGSRRRWRSAVGMDDGAYLPTCEW